MSSKPSSSTAIIKLSCNCPSGCIEDLDKESTSTGFTNLAAESTGGSEGTTTGICVTSNASAEADGGGAGSANKALTVGSIGASALIVLTAVGMSTISSTEAGSTGGAWSSK